MTAPIVITEQEIRGHIAQQASVSKLVESLGWPELLACLAVAAETESRFCGNADVQRKWRKLSKRLRKTGQRAEDEGWQAFAIDLKWKKP